MQRNFQTMKKYFLLAAAALTLFIASCSDETVNPTVDPRDKFTGSWLCVETIAQSQQPFSISISKVLINLRCSSKLIVDKL